MLLLTINALLLPANTITHIEVHVFANMATVVYFRETGAMKDGIEFLKLGIHMHVCVCGYRKYQNPKINREGILIYGCVCVYA